MSAQYIPKEKLTAYERWEVAAFDEAERVARAMANAQAKGPAAPPEPPPEPLVEPPPPSLSEEELAALRDEASVAGRLVGHAEGLVTGHAEGFAQGISQAEDVVARLGHLASQFDQAIQSTESALANDLLRLALDIARQVIRTELVVQPELILPVVKEAMATLASQHGHPVLFVHPDDAALVRQHLADQIAHTAWRIAEDPTLDRGGCRIENGGAEVDATLQERWRRVIETLGANTEWTARG